VKASQDIISAASTMHTMVFAALRECSLCRGSESFAMAERELTFETNVGIMLGLEECVDVLTRGDDMEPANRSLLANVMIHFAVVINL